VRPFIHVSYVPFRSVVWGIIASFLNRVGFVWDVAPCRMVIGGVLEELGLPSSLELR